MSTIRTALESSDQIVYDIHLTGITESTVRRISTDQEEPDRMLQHRLKSLEIFQKMKMPSRGPSLRQLHLDDIVYYARPSKAYEGSYATSRDDVYPTIRAKFDKLGIPEAEKKYLAGVGGQMDSNNIYHQIKAKRAEQ